jgi:O-antigen/teichoic acid export membrane protein
MASWVVALRALRDRANWRDEHTRNVLSFLLCRVVGIALFAISVPYFVRSRNGVDYGAIALLFNVFTYIAMLDLGIGYAVNLRFARAIARGRNDSGQIVSSAITLFLIIGGVISLAVFACGPAISSALLGTSRDAAAIEVLGASATFVMVSSVLASVVQAYNRMDLANVSRLILDVVKALALVVAAIATDSVLMAMAVLLAGIVLKTGFDLLLLRRVSGGLQCAVPGWDRRELRINFHFGLPMALAAAITIVFWTADRVYVSREYGAAALTSYSLGADVCSKAFFLVWAVTRSVFTVLIRQKARRVDSSLILKISIGAVILVAALFYLPLFAFAPQLLGIWVGPEVASKSAAVTRIWCIGSVAYLAMTVYYNYLQAAGRPRTLLALNTVAAAALIAGLLVMPAQYGIEGVAILMCLVFALQAAVTWVLAEQARALAARRFSTS